MKIKNSNVSIMSRKEAKKFWDNWWKEYIQIVTEQGYENQSHQNVPNEIWFRATEV